MLLKTIDDKFLEDIAKRGRKRTSHYPSDISACDRQLYYKWQGIEESNPFDLLSKYRFVMGDSIHDSLYDILKSTGLDIRAEVSGKYYHNVLHYPISYRVDNLFVHDDVTCGAEIKTTFGRGISDIIRNRRPKKEHEAQVLTYLSVENKINRWHLIYLGRDNMARCEFIYHRMTDGFSRTLIEAGSAKGAPPTTVYWNFDAIVQKLARLETHVAARQIPDRCFVACKVNGVLKDMFTASKVKYKSDWQCRYCNWRELCWSTVPNDGKWCGEERVV
jgi:hypothetical protein